MNNTDEKNPKNSEPKTPDQDSENGVQKTPEDAVKEPAAAPVPAQDDIEPPLEATVGGDDLVTPTEEK